MTLTIAQSLRREGRREGREEGLEEGRREGRREAKKATQDIARNLLHLGVPLDKIAQATQLSEQAVRALENELTPDRERK